jgi:serpin B
MSSVHGSAAASNDLGWRLLETLAGDATQNLAISPLSVASALALLANGAAGATQRELRETLGVGEWTIEEVDEAAQEVRKELLADDEVTLDVADSLWVSPSFALLPAFIQRARRDFGARVESLDPGDPEAVGRVNKWVWEQTRGKIPRIVDDVRGLTALLLDAIYSHGRWEHPFDPARTRPRPFRVPRAEPAPVPMMARQGRFPYQEQDAYTAVGLPYGRGAVAMFLFLPRPGGSVRAMLQNLATTGWQRVAAGFATREGEVILPRFRLSVDRRLNAALTQVGMVDAFDPTRADFRGLSPTPGLYVQDVIHRVVLEVDEEGTEAAAVTGIGIAALAMLPPPPFRFVADCPFGFAIADRRSQAILFAGVVADPRSW